jgi:ABC-type glycerol-3-phosphate transport system substrate-binding protein
MQAYRAKQPPHIVQVAERFRHAGLGDEAPTTWDEVEAMTKKLRAAGQVSVWLGVAVVCPRR